MTREKNMFKLHFRLERDEDGFPPADVESLWVSEHGNTFYAIENVPFFVRGIALHDVVRAADLAGALWFNGVVAEGGHGTIRVMLQDKSSEESVKQFVRECGCSMEQSHIPGYFAIDVPPDAAKGKLVAFLTTAEQAETLSYDEGCKTW